MEKDKHKKESVAMMQSVARAEVICDQINYDNAVSQAWGSVEEEDPKWCHEHCLYEFVCKRAFMVNWAGDEPEDIGNRLGCDECTHWEES